MKLFVDNLTNIDFSYLDAKRGLVGESWLAGLLIEGKLNDESMICDFGIVKRNAKQWLDLNIDHTLVVPSRMDGIEIKTLNGITEVTMPYANGKGTLYCSGPSSAFCIIDAKAVTTMAIGPWIANHLNGNIPGDIQNLSVSLKTELIGGAYYHYTHGLKKHDGNCQRIAHGHRSKLEIFINNARQPELEKAWAKKWKDIYVGTSEDLTATYETNGIKHNHYHYEAPQGEFTLKLPSSHCYDMNSDTTVESIADHIAAILKQSYPKQCVLVRAYEGVAKGAIAEYE